MPNSDWHDTHPKTKSTMRDSEEHMRHVSGPIKLGLWVKYYEPESGLDPWDEQNTKGTCESMHPHDPKLPQPSDAGMTSDHHARGMREPWASKEVRQFHPRCSSGMWLTNRCGPWQPTGAKRMGQHPRHAVCRRRTGAGARRRRRRHQESVEAHHPLSSGSAGVSESQSSRRTRGEHTA